jgi:hypothetical protein
MKAMDFQSGAWNQGGCPYPELFHITSAEKKINYSG